MKKSLLLFFLANFSLFAQENFLETYHPYRNKAEMAIVEGNYAVASAAYKTAFESVKNPLAKDIFNATVCKFLQNDFEGAKPLLLKLAKKGIAAQNLEAKEAFAITSIKNDWQNFKTTYNQIQSYAVEKMDSTIWTKIKKLYIETIEEHDNRVYKYSEMNGLEAKSLGRKFKISSKEFRNLRNTDSSFKKKEYSLTEDLESDAIRKIDSLHVAAREELLKMIQKFGFLSEEDSFLADGTNVFAIEKLERLNNFRITAIQDKFLFNRMSILVEEYNLLANYKDMGMWNKLKQDKNGLFEFQKSVNEALLKGVRTGKINPDVAIRLGYKDSLHVLNDISIFKIKIEDKTECKEELLKSDYVTFYKPKPINDSQRKAYSVLIEKLGLETLEELHKKRIYSTTKNDFFIFNLKFQLEETTVPSCFSANEMLKGAIKIE
jgi:hypothetical protein